MRNIRIIVLGALTVLLAAGCGADAKPDGIPQAAPTNGAGCEQQADGTAWQPAALSTQDGDAWQPPTEPHAIGEQITVGDWKIKVTHIDYDAGNTVGDRLEQPPGDHQWVVVLATLTYDGPEPSGSAADLESRYLGADGVLYESVDPCPGAAATELPVGEATIAASLTAVPADQVAGGTWGIAAVTDPDVDDLTYVR